MVFGAGVLVSAVALELTEEAYRQSGGVSVVIGMVLSAVVSFLGDW